MAPTTLGNQRTTTSPAGRNVEDVGMPIKMAELLAALQTPAYITRQSVLKPKHVFKAKKAIKKAFQYQMEGRCYSMVEVISNCPTNWGMTPLDSLQWAEKTLLSYYPIGDYKTPDVA
jgi:2-oxoglutarate ferredoxin oxidoreductase subunit beta